MTIPFEHSNLPVFEFLILHYIKIAQHFQFVYSVPSFGPCFSQQTKQLEPSLIHQTAALYTQSLFNNPT